jgi:hypothetical protein
MYETQVKAGMAYLDKHDVPEWKSLINLDELSMMHKDACVLGQRFADRGVWNGFDWAQEHFGLASGDMIRLGFDIGQTGSYGALTTEWILALRVALKVAATSGNSGSTTSSAPSTLGATA